MMRPVLSPSTAATAAFRPAKFSACWVLSGLVQLPKIML